MDEKLVEKVARALGQHWLDVISEISMVGFSKEEREEALKELGPWDDYARAAIQALEEAGWIPPEKLGKWPYIFIGAKL